MENTETTEPVVDNKGKKPIERSAAYPVYSIETSLQFASDFYKQFRNTIAKRDDVANLIKGYSNSKIAACGHYGLLEREKDGYKITDRYRTIANYVDEKEKTIALLEAFETPTLYKELIEKFDGGIVPDNLHVHLFRFHRITEAVAPNAADIFIANAKYIGVLDTDNKLVYKYVVDLAHGASSIVVIPPTPTTPNGITETPTPPITTLQGSNSQPTPQLLLEEITNEEKLTIKLTDNRRAILSYPRNLNEKDIAILKLQLESLALTV